MQLSQTVSSRTLSTIVLVTAALAPPALAHSPYLLPNVFDVSQRDHVSVQASFTENFFVPDVVMQAAEYHVVMPDGTKTPLAPVYTQDLAVLDVETKAPGTYRISTGIREGRLSKATIHGDEWVFLDEREPLPAGVRVYDIRSITRAEVYVTRGAPTAPAIAARNDGLEFVLLSHPNSLFAGDQVQLRVLFKGQPLAAQPIAFQRAADFGGMSTPLETATDAEGRVTFDLPSPGLYHIMTRHRFALPAAEAKAESHTYAVTLEVTE
jgi:uncharacterized GH25 family protein